MAVLLAHLLAVYVVVAAPGLGRILYRRAQQRMLAGDPMAKIRLYRSIFIEQIVTTAVVLGFWLWGRIPAAGLGLGAPRSWWLSLGLSAALGGLMIWRSVHLRPRAQKIRDRFNDRVGALLPDTPAEARWFSVISVGAGISEELVYRGFLFYYLALWFPHINRLESALVTSLIFGVGHLYQGWKGILSTGIAGLFLAGLYLLSGNLLLPIVVHAVGDLQAVILLGGQPASGTATEQAA
jgi:membrane protease YdiL (CAAX protease family)